MEAGNLYELEFPYEEGQGAARRPVLIIVVNTDMHKAIGLKVTQSGSDRYPHRIPVCHSPHSNLKESFVQYDRFQVFDNVTLPSRGKLSEQDFKAIVKAFKEYHDV